MFAIKSSKELYDGETDDGIKELNSRIPNGMDNQLKNGGRTCQKKP